METMRDIMLVIHFIGLVMGLGTGFAHMFLGIAGSKMEKAEAEDFAAKVVALDKMGVIGIILLILSGGYLMTPHWANLANLPLLMVKLTLVVILTVLIAVLVSLGKKVTNNSDINALHKMEKVGKITLPLGIIIVILAVLVFH